MSSQVALRKESVDRNIKAVVSYNIKETSLSARRAWIEIKCRYLPGYNQKVALRKESVDRNRSTHKTSWYACSSLSARRAWIEIQLVLWVLRKVPLSLSARRAWIEINIVARIYPR